MHLITTRTKKTAHEISFISSLNPNRNDMTRREENPLLIRRLKRLGIKRIIEGIRPCRGSRYSLYARKKPKRLFRNKPVQASKVIRFLGLSRMNWAASMINAWTRRKIAIQNWVRAGYESNWLSNEPQFKISSLKRTLRKCGACTRRLLNNKSICFDTCKHRIILRIISLVSPREARKTY